VNCTFDTNLLVYAIVEPPDAKAARARELLARCTRNSSAVLLLQSLAEFSHVAMRRFGAGAGEVRHRVSVWRRIIPVHAAGDEDLMEALDLVRDHRIAFWDALMCATASRAGLDYLLSEDMQDGRRFGGLTIVNPFRPENAALIDRILPP
jgi:predicted nucleic acid-binding protein